MSEKNLDKKIIDIFREKEKVNIGYIVAGYPSVDFTKQFLQNLDNTALDMLEIGIPYSDPLADGKLISHASFLASEAGVTTDTVFDLLTEVKNDISKPLIFLVYYNLVFAYGIDEFIKKCCETNIKGIIIPDLPYEEAFEMSEKLRENNIAYPSCKRYFFWKQNEKNYFSRQWLYLCNRFSWSYRFKTS